MHYFRIFSFLAIVFLYFSHNALAAGDCNGNGTVTIPEVQTAISMFLGLEQPLSCVDEDSSGSVSTAEVQKTVNSFLVPPAQSAQIVACPAGTTDVTIRDFFFLPSATTISVNGIVKWTNSGTFVHTVTSGSPPAGDGKFNSGTMGTGTTVCVQFLAAGSYPYFCAIHTTMTGTITVQ